MCLPKLFSPYLHRVAWCIIAAIPFLTACTARHPLLFSKGYRAETQDQVGSVHISLLNIAPWSSYRDALMPDFKLSASDALQKSVPTTARLEMEFLDAAKTALQINLAQSSKNYHSKEVSGDNTSLEVTEEKKKVPGEVPTISADNILNEEFANSGNNQESSLDIPAMLHYRAATALYQEVKLLERYVKDAASDGYDAYLVRLQVTMMPKIRNAPYDAYTDLTFFKKTTSNSNSDGQTPMPEQPINPLIVKRPSPGGGEASKENPVGGKSKNNAYYSSVLAIPLFVTDEIEEGAVSNTTQQIQQMVLGLSALINNAGIGAQYAKNIKDLAKSVAYDSNSLFTIGSVSNNTLRIRIGAMRQATTKYAMVPGTRNVTVLVLVEPEDQKSSGELLVHSATDMVDVETGKVLPARTTKDINQLVIKALESTGLNITEEFRKEWITLGLKLTADVQQNSLPNFYKRLVSRQKELIEEQPTGQSTVRSQIVKDLEYIKSHALQLWTALNHQLQAGSKWAQTSRVFPDKPDPSLIPVTTYLLQDNGKTTTLRLHGRELGIANFDVRLYLPKGDDQKVSELVGVANKERTDDYVDISFPSLRQWGLVDRNTASSDTAVSLEDWSACVKIIKTSENSECKSDSTSSIIMKYAVTQPVNPKPVIPFKVINIADPVLVNSNGESQHVLDIEAMAGQSFSGAQLWLTGAQIEKADKVVNGKIESSDTKVVNSHVVTIPSAGQYKLHLHGVRKEVPLNLYVKRKEGDEIRTFAEHKLVTILTSATPTRGNK